MNNIVTKPLAAVVSSISTGNQTSQRAVTKVVKERMFQNATMETVKPESGFGSKIIKFLKKLFAGPSPEELIKKLKNKVEIAKHKLELEKIRKEQERIRAEHFNFFFKWFFG